MYGYRMMDGYGYGHGPESIWGWVMMLLWAVILVAVVMLIVRAMKGQDHHGMHHMHSGHSVDAIEIVKERYAKGEIDKEQFEQLKKDLSK
jgi:putative membrane protein